jgi:hypothetical protein
MTKYTAPDIVDVIASIRDSFVGSEHVYKNGSCWWFARILKTIYPNGLIYENHSHAVFFLDGKYYDIEGELHPDKHTGIEPVAGMSRTEKFDMFNFVKRIRA